MDTTFPHRPEVEALPVGLNPSTKSWLSVCATKPEHGEAIPRLLAQVVCLRSDFLQMSYLMRSQDMKAGKVGMSLSCK